MPKLEKDRYAIQSVEKALDILETISELEGDVSVAGLSDKLAINKTTIFRLLATFEKRGYVERAASGNYRIGMSAFETGQKLLSGMGLLRKAKPVMQGLVRDINESVYLAVPAGLDILMVDSVETTQQVQVIPLIGKRFPAEKTSAGKIIRAYQNRFTTDPDLRQIHMAGGCLESDGLGDGISSVSVPLFNAREVVEGCLCFVGPTFRLTAERIEKDLLQPLKDAGQNISSQLGYNLPFN